MQIEKLLAAIAIPLVLAASAPVAAQAFPHKPIRVIVPYGPGGGTDILLRTIVPKLSEELGQPVVVDNRPGGSTIIGTSLVARGVPDGYTLLMVDFAFEINPSLFAKLPYDSLKDFAPVIFVASTPSLMLVHPTVPVRSLKELVALAKQRPGQLTYASAGIGSGGHMASEMFKLAAGVDMLHVPYKGAGPAMADALGGHTTMMFSIPGASKELVRSGRMIGLAVSGERRMDSIPQVPTFAEAGYPDVNLSKLSDTWGVYAPAGTPREIIGRVNAAFNRTLQAPESRLRLADLDFTVGGGTPEAWAAEVHAGFARWALVVKKANIKIQ